MRRFLALIAALVLALTLAVSAAPASAHITDTENAAIAKVRNAWPNRCGNGLIWWCVQDPAPVGSKGDPHGEHSRYTVYQWVEARPGLLRGCNVIARVMHGAVVQVYRDETCW